MTLLTTVFAAAAISLGLAILVQAFEQWWKYVLSTKGAAYQRPFGATSSLLLPPWSRLR